MKDLNLNSLILRDLRKQEMAQTLGAAGESACLSNFCGDDVDLLANSGELIPEVKTVKPGTR